MHGATIKIIELCSNNLNTKRNKRRCHYDNMTLNLRVYIKESCWREYTTAVARSYECGNECGEYGK